MRFFWKNAPRGELNGAVRQWAAFPVLMDFYICRLKSYVFVAAHQALGGP